MSRYRSFFRTFSRLARGADNAKPRERRLRFEPLEDRRLLAVLHVDGVIGDDQSGDGSAGSPFATIQRGVGEAAALSGDDIVDIQPGLYSGSIMIDDASGAVTLRGSTGNAADVATYIVTATLTNNVRVESMSLEYDVRASSGTADISIDNVVAKGQLYVPTSAGDILVSNSQFGHLYARNFQDLVIQNVDLIEGGQGRGHINAQYGQQVTIDGGTWNDGTGNGIYLADVGDVSIKNVSVSGRQYSGIFLNRTQNVELENVIAKGNVGNGIYLDTVANVSLQSIEASDNLNYGIFTRYAEAVTGAGITANANGTGAQAYANGALFWEVLSVDLDGGEFSDNVRNGLVISNVTAPVNLVGVSAHNNGERGLRVEANGQSVAISGGSFSSNGLRGVALYAPNGVTISDVNVSNNGSPNLVANQTDGGGIRINTTDTGAIVVDNATVVGNTSLVTGAGIGISTLGTATVSNSLVQGNSNQFGQSRGGGIYFNEYDGTHIVRDSTIDQNASLDGGGIWSRGNLTIERSTIAGNTAVTGGGGVWAFSNGSLLVSQSTLSGNFAGSIGGGIRFGNQVAHIVNSTISGNSSGGDGGGVSVGYGQPVLDWNTIVNNSAATNGGGVYAAVGIPRLVANIIATNSAAAGPDVHGSVYNTNGFATGGNVVGDGSDSIGFDQFDQVGTSADPIDPLIGPLQDNGGTTKTHALLPGSPAIDIPGDGWVDVDQRGVARPVDGDRDGDPFRIVDAGAFEYENTAPSAVDAVFSLEENSPAETEVGMVDADDVDGDTLTYALIGEDAAAFAINAQGQITVADAALLDFETNPRFDFFFEVSDGHGGQTTASVRINLTDVLEVAIDVLPNDPDNKINLRSKEIEVAILGADGFDPYAMVDLESVRLSAAGASSGAGIASSRKHGVKIEQRDVNDDGILDLVMKFKTSEIGLQAGDTSVQLTGNLLPGDDGEDGDAFLVEQSVTVVSGGGGGKGKGKNK